MSLDPAIVFGFSLICLGNLKLGWRKNVQQAISSVIAIAGVTCAALGGTQSEGEYNYGLGSVLQAKTMKLKRQILTFSFVMIFIIVYY